MGCAFCRGDESRVSLLILVMVMVRWGKDRKVMDEWLLLEDTELRQRYISLRIFSWASSPFYIIVCTCDYQFISQHYIVCHYIPRNVRRPYAETESPELLLCPQRWEKNAPAKLTRWPLARLSRHLPETRDSFLGLLLVTSR